MSLRSQAICILLTPVWLISLAVQAQAQSNEVTKAISPKDGVIRLFNGKDLGGLYTFLQDTKYEDPRKVFTVRDHVLVISGEGYGGIITERTYKDYHLICEFKWGRRTWGKRKERSRDSGILVHGAGPDDSFGGRWMVSFEAQIIEGGLGDIITLAGTDAAGRQIPLSLRAEVTTDRDGETVWEKGADRKTFSSVRINWYGRDPDWQDVLGFRGTDDIGDPCNEWTRMDVICDGSHMRILVNGVLVNEAFDVTPSAGKITLQTEDAEILIRRWELWPLGKAPAYKTRNRLASQEMSDENNR